MNSLIIIYWECLVF